MEYWTFTEPLAGKYRRIINFGGRGFWCAFDYALTHEIGIEGIEVIQTATLEGDLREWFPSIKRGIENAFRSFLDRGCSINAVRVEIKKIYTHSVDTTERGCESYGYHFLCDLVQSHGKKIQPLSATILKWNNNTIPMLAKKIDNERGFDKLPILADALEDAGCTADDILGHCRYEGGHDRGCWVLNLILGKQ